MTNDSRPVQRPASNSTARKRDEDARAVSYSWPLSEAQVAALVERLEAERDAYREEVAKAAALRATERVVPGVEVVEALLRHANQHGWNWRAVNHDGAFSDFAQRIAALYAAQPTVAEVKAQTLREAAEVLQRDMDETPGPRPLVAMIPVWLRERADRIGGGV